MRLVIFTVVGLFTASGFLLAAELVIGGRRLTAGANARQFAGEGKRGAYNEEDV
jgi:hypothetical protein